MSVKIPKNYAYDLRKYYKHSRKQILAHYHKLINENKKTVDLMLLYNDYLRCAHYQNGSIRSVRTIIIHINELSLINGFKMLNPGFMSI